MFTIKTIQTMAAQGATEQNNPEYAKLINALRTIQKNNLIAQMQQQQQLLAGK
jgi:hypothetical protein